MRKRPARAGVILPAAPFRAPWLFVGLLFFLMMGSVGTAMAGPLLAPGAVRILGPAGMARTLLSATMGRASAQHAAVARSFNGGGAVPAARNNCVYYADGVGGQIGLPGPNTTLTLSSLDLVPSPSNAHPGIAINATSPGIGTLTAAAPLPPETLTPSPITKTVTNYDAIVTSTGCTSGQLVVTLASTPTGPGGSLESTLAGSPSIILASYNASFISQGTYLCYNRKYFNCTVWAVNLTLNFDPTGVVLGGTGPMAAGTYTMVMNPPTYTVN